MIARLSGTLARKSAEALLVDVNGVGYEVFTSVNTLSVLPAEGESVILEIRTCVRDGAVELFGFAELLEKTVFGHLLTVAGVGPRMALAILSGLAARELLEALSAGDTARLVRVPGVGKKRAERLVVELRDRVQGLRGTAVPVASGAGKLAGEAVSALVNLGYRPGQAETAVRSVIKRGETDLAVLIRACLQRLGG